MAFKNSFYNLKKHVTSGSARAINPESDPKMTDLEKVDYYCRNRKCGAGERVLSASMCEDIDLNEFFIFADCTESIVGEQYLYSRLLTDKESIDFEEQESWVGRMERDKSLSGLLQKLLSRLKRREAYYLPHLFLDLSFTKPFYHGWMQLLSLLPLLLLVVSFWEPACLFLLFGVLLINLMIHLHNKRIMFMYQDSIPPLYSLICAAEGLLNLEGPAGYEKERTAVKKLSGDKYKMQLFTLESKSDDSLLSLLYLVFDYLKVFFLIEPLWAYRLLDKLKKHQEEVETLFTFVGRIDSYLSVYRLRKQLSFYTLPAWGDEVKAELSFTDLYHPLIGDCVPNSLDTEGKSVLLTGSNMAGKTSFIRAVALNVLSAKTLNTAFAKSIRLSPFALYSSIRITDSLNEGVSYYQKEVQTIGEMIEASTKSGTKLFLLDELYKGTNTQERIAAGKAVLNFLADPEENMVFVSTHDIELAALLEKNYELYHFTETVSGDAIHFDYKLKRGVLTTRNAIRILQLNAYPESIIQEALSLLENSKKNHI